MSVLDRAIQRWGDDTPLARRTYLTRQEAERLKVTRKYRIRRVW